MLRPLNVQLVSGYSTDWAIKSFLPAKKTIAAARASGLSIGAYIDQAFVEPGATPKLVAEMLRLAELPSGVRVCEIGAGSGRYSEEVINALHPASYEIYETALDWLPHLRSLPNAIVRDADGRTLSQTDDVSVDFVHAQKTFVYLDPCVVISYLEEMVRVVRPGGIVAFDVVTENCLDDETAHAWVRHNSIYRLCPRTWVTGYLQRQGLTLLGSSFTPLPPGRSELLVFRRVETPGTRAPPP
jgi:SAM-dependent methyltransferase